MVTATESYSDRVEHLSDSRSAQRKAKAAKVDMRPSNINLGQQLELPTMIDKSLYSKLTGKG